MSTRKKLVLLGLTVLLCSPLAAYAASIGDAETQGQFKFSIGLDQEFIFKRDLEFKSADPPIAPLKMEDVKIENLYRTMIKGSFGIFDFLDVYVRLGVADDKSEGDFVYAGLTLAEFDAKMRAAFAYGVGLKATYPLGNGFLIGADLQYLKHRNKVKGDISDTLGLGLVAPFEGKVTLQQWHFAPYAALKIQNVTPYAGLKYSDVRIRAGFEDEETGETATYKLKADDRVGLFGGLTYVLTPNLKLNLEGRFIDESALSLGLTYKF